MVSLVLPRSEQERYDKFGAEDSDLIKARQIDYTEQVVKDIIKQSKC